MSIEVLTKPKHRHTIADDLESFYYVIVYISCCLLPHETPDSSLNDLMAKYFCSYTRVKGVVDGGTDKYMDMTHDSNPRTFSKKIGFGFVSEWIFAFQEQYRKGGRAVDLSQMRAIWACISKQKIPEDDRCVHVIDIQRELPAVEISVSWHIQLHDVYSCFRKP